MLLTNMRNCLTPCVFDIYIYDEKLEKEVGYFTMEKRGGG